MGKVTMTKRFYVGSAKMVHNDWLCTLGEATEKAKELVQEGNQDVRYVVEVVRVVRKQSMPVVVEEVRRG